MIFVDEARIFVKAGGGGKGCESYYRDLYMRHPRPDGGDGGRGGDIIITATRSVQTLLDFRYKQHYKALSGGHASSKGKRGKDGKSLVLYVPKGTIVRDVETNLIIKDLVDDEQSVVVAKGGRGGLGNAQRKFTTPPTLGEERTIFLELKVIADVGIVGFPNAGKSTLISALSKVKSKIANYPFTTKQPILGIVPGNKSDTTGYRTRDFIVADLPGLIEGAHLGKGLGHRFLRHAERTKILVHMIDMAGTEVRDPLEDYEKVMHELSSYSEILDAKHKIVVANKMDIPEAQENFERFQKKFNVPIYAVSAATRKGFPELIEQIRKILWQENSQEKSGE